MDGKQPRAIHDISSPATLYYVIVCNLEKEVTANALFIILRQVMTVTNPNKKVINRLYKNTVTEQ